MQHSELFMACRVQHAGVKKSYPKGFSIILKLQPPVVTKAETTLNKNIKMFTNTEYNKLVNQI